MGAVCDSGVRCAGKFGMYRCFQSRECHLRQPRMASVIDQTERLEIVICGSLGWLRLSIRPNVSREGEPVQHRHQWTAWTGLAKSELCGERIRNGGGLGWRHRPSELGSATSPRSNKAAPALGTALGELGMELGGESRS